MAAQMPIQSKPLIVACTHELGGLPCVNRAPHRGGGRGCIHHSTSGVPDRHDRRAA